MKRDHLIFFVAGLIVFAYLFFFSWSYPQLLNKIIFARYDDKETLDLNEWGGYVSGVWGTLISLFSLAFTFFGSIYVYRTFKSQKDQSYIDSVINLIFRHIESIKTVSSKLSFEDAGNELATEMKALDMYTLRLHIVNNQMDNSHTDRLNDTENLLTINSIEQEIMDFRLILCKSLNFLNHIINEKSRQLRLQDRTFLYQIIHSSFDINQLLFFLTQSLQILNFRILILDRRDRNVGEPIAGLGDATVNALRNHREEVRNAIDFINNEISTSM